MMRAICGIKFVKQRKTKDLMQMFGSGETMDQPARSSKLVTGS